MSGEDNGERNVKGSENVIIICVKILWFITYSLPLRLQKEFFNIMKRSELERLLTDAGCICERHGGRHDKWINPKTGKTDWIPRHAKEVPKGTALSILKNLS